MSESRMDKTRLGDAVLSAWDDAMDRFFEKVDNKRRELGLTPEEARIELNRGYGMDVADDWAEWVGEDE